MNKEQLFQSIETILSYLQEYNRIQVIDFSKNPSDKDLFKKVLKEIYPSIQPDFTCSSCVVNYLNNLQAYYEREHKKWIKAQPAFHFVGIAETPIEEAVQEEKQVEKKPRKPKRK